MTVAGIWTTQSNEDFQAEFGTKLPPEHCFRRHSKKSKENLGKNLV